MDIPDESAEEAPVAPIVRRRATRKTLTEIRSLARSHTRTAINVLAGIMRSNEATPAARVSAANAILDRGWGKAPQRLETGEDGLLEVIHRVERVIVYPTALGCEQSHARRQEDAALVEGKSQRGEAPSPLP